ncbi:Interferon-induced protein with tetratricopeptide repeats 2 [Dissostichus eleginoides]|uniref:Interferon-induced protein with tetratricopeptide repeats 2 n=1 Tax=Dissostichus eleginoides TaxID=100907 RepID=A0AAD9BBY1_DISEL|nr:Interferon-induced protein with tetratricopeptide repeats 2 [Dissostichus eleginoides]
MMSAAPTLVSRLKALQCHFTWDLDLSRSLLLHCRDNLLDIGTENGNPWLGHIYNMRGFIHCKVGFIEDDQSFFDKATEAFSQIKNTECEAYLSKIDALNTKYPSPSQGELHPETYAEKAYTLMMFNGDISLVADYIQKAIKMQPDNLEWNSWHVLALLYASKQSRRGLGHDIFEKMKIAQEQDPENLYLAAQYLFQRAKREKSIEDEARELATKVLSSPVSSYSGLRPLLLVYRKYISVDEAIVLAEEVLKNHPDERYLKRLAASCYYEGRLFFIDSPQWKNMLDRAISLHEEVIALYPHSSLMRNIHLAMIYAESRDSKAKAEPIYQGLLKSDLEPAGKQVLFNMYANYLYSQRQGRNIRYHMDAAKIQHQSVFRKNSIKVLENIRDKGRHSMCGKITTFLANLQ